MKRVLITGAGGFLGTAVLEAFQSAGWQTVACARNSGDAAFDFEKPGWPALVEKIAPCAVIAHVASRVDLSAAAKDEDFKPTNQDAARALSQIAKSWRARVVFASSVSVYKSSRRIDSRTPVSPETAYGRAKAGAEDILAQSGVPWTALRFSGIFGLNGAEHLGLNKSITAALGKRPPLLVGGGAGLRNYAYVHDAAASVLEAVEKNLAGPHIVAGPEPISIAQMLEQTLAVLWPGGKIERRPGGAGSDMVAEHSSKLSPGRKFGEALLDIRSLAQKKVRC